MAHRLAGIGYILIGGYLNLTLFGVTLTQAWIYFIRFPYDPWGMKAVVVILCSADTANTITLSAALYQWLILERDPTKLIPAFLGGLETSALSAVIAQFFFAWRVQQLRRQCWITGLIVFFSLGGLVGATFTIAWPLTNGSFQMMTTIQAPLLLWSSSFVASDLITAIALYDALRRRASGFGVTNHRIDRIKNLILQTTALTMAIDLVHLIIVAYSANYQLHFSASEAVSKVYVNSLLSTLTTRSSAQQLLDDDLDDVVHVSRSTDRPEVSSWRPKFYLKESGASQDWESSDRHLDVVPLANIAPVQLAQPRPHAEARPMPFKHSIFRAGKTNTEINPPSAARATGLLITAMQQKFTDPVVLNSTPATKPPGLNITSIKRQRSSDSAQASATTPHSPVSPHIKHNTGTSAAPAAGSSYGSSPGRPTPAIRSAAGTGASLLPDGPDGLVADVEEKSATAADVTLNKAPDCRPAASVAPRQDAC